MSATAPTHSGPEEPPALIFDQGHGTRARWRLGLMILAALLAHAASFYVLQVAYTPTGSLLPPPARVVLVPLDRPENASLAHWLSLMDLTLATQSSVPAAGAVLDSLGFRYVPSYDAMPPAFKPLDPVAPAEGIAVAPRPFAPGPVAMPPPPADTRAMPAAGPSHVMFDAPLAARTPAPPPVRFAGSAGIKPLEPTVFLVGVRPEGGMPFLFPLRQGPSNNASADADEADEFARDYLSRLVFRPAGAPEGGTVWGRATFYWGSDARPKER